MKIDFSYYKTDIGNLIEDIGAFFAAAPFLSNCAQLEAGKLENNLKTLQELRMLSSVTLNCQVTKIVMNSGSQLSEFNQCLDNGEI